MQEQEKIKTERTLKVIGHVHSDFHEKFGIPRQSGLVPGLYATVVFTPSFRAPAFCKGLEAFSHIWLLWGFSEAWRQEDGATVRPPRLGGNTRMGVFATRSPFRPNGIGLSSVKLEGIELHVKLGMVLHIVGADILDGSPVYDIKPYLAYTDSHPEAAGGFAAAQLGRKLQVQIAPQCLDLVPRAQRDALMGILAQDPRPSYQENPQRLYGMAYAGMEIKFTVCENVLTVQRIEPAE